VRLTAAAVTLLRRVASDAPETPFTIDLETQTVSTPRTPPMTFAIDPLSKACFMRGIDDISFTAEYNARIDAFVETYRARHPWLVLPPRRTSPLQE
jgi:3-isopropylmalate/(R)-2-methylmalate dehydratase small subunit